MFPSTKMFIFFVVFMFQREAKAGSFCSKSFLKPEGKFRFPTSECESSHSWEFIMKPRQSLRVSFDSLDLQDNLLKVQGKTFSKDDYKIVQVVAMETTEVIIRPPTRFVKITMEGAKGSFKAEYEVFSCEVPKMLERTKCSDGFRKHSTCEFKCHSPRYFPSTPEDMTIQAKCGNNMAWTTDLEKKCIGIEELEEKCLGDKNECPFNQHELQTILKDHKVTFMKKFAKVTSSPQRIRRSSDSDAYIQWALTADATALYCVEIQACHRNRTNNQYLFQCANHPDKTLALGCFVCRHDLEICDEPTIPVLYL